MIESVGNSPQIYNCQYNNSSVAPKSLMNFDIEDESIISAQAKILNELEKYNSGDGSELELAMACKLGELQVDAAATVIKTKDEMMDAIMEIMD